MGLNQLHYYGDLIRSIGFEIKRGVKPGYFLMFVML